MVTFVRRHMGAKLFLSYLGVILAGVIVLYITAEVALPTAFNRHLAGMGQGMMLGMGQGQGQGRGLMMGELFLNFRSAVQEALLLGTLAASVTAVIVSLYISRRIVRPVRAMMDASQRIAEGHYNERVQALLENPERQDELDQLAEHFNRMAGTLEETENMRRQLIGDVAHELRTPLTTIKGSMEGLIDGVLPADGTTFQQIYIEADRMQRLVEDLQELSRVESGAYELDLQNIDIKRLVEDGMNRLRRQYEEKGVGLRSQIPTLPPITGDEGRLGQVLTNLMGNSLQYTLSGGEVLVWASQVGEDVRITVTDTGVGIPPDQLNRVFDRFYRVDPSRKRPGGGSGIGLTIARYLVEAHGGRIWAESAGEGKGSTFVFTLPLARQR